MLLKNILNSLIRTELKNIVDGKPEWSDATKFNYVHLIDCVSQANVELHKRFLLKKGFVKIVPLDTRNTYPLDPQYAISNATIGDKFIYDSVEDPFPENIVKIDTLLDKDMDEITFNTTTFKDAITIKDEKTLYIPDPVILPLFYAVCRLLPEPILLTQESELDTYDLDLSPVYLQALLCFAAGKVYINRGAENATNNESAIFFARYEQACAEIEALGFSPKERMVNHKLSNRGFV